MATSHRNTLVPIAQLCPPPGDPVSQWQDHLAAECGLRPSTITDYVRFLALFGGWLQRPLQSATRQDIQGYLAHLLRRVSGRSVYPPLCALRSFYRFLYAEEIIERDPVRGIKTPCYSHKLPDWLTPQQTRKLLRTAEEAAGAISLRNVLVLHLLYGSGLRATEVATIRMENIVPDFSAVKILGKGARERIQLLSHNTRNLLERYLQQSAVRGEYLFPRYFDKAHRYSDKGHISRQRIWGIVRDAAIAAKLSIHPHTLRHSAASHMVTAGADVTVVQEFLGHSHPETTMIYAHLDLRALRRCFNKFHPHA